MEILTLFLVAAISVSVPPALAVRGLNRLEPANGTGMLELLLAAILGCLVGIASSWSLAETGAPGSMRLAAVSAFCSLAAVSALVDARTSWAPIELVLPLCIAATLAGSSDIDGYGPLLILGTVIFLASRTIWEVQSWLGRRHLPPADLVALTCPILLLGSGAASLSVYCILLAALLVIRCAPRARVGHCIQLSFAWHMLSDRRIALLGLANPILLLCLLVFGVDG